MSWQRWTLRDWNRALANAIFLGQERIDVPVTRINASNVFLASCTGDAGCQPDDARKSFVRAFGASAAGMRAHFKVGTGRMPLYEGHPTFVAPLYLTLLAASADESTYDMGNFRERFATIVLPVEVGPVSFEDLPSMWKAVAQWSQERHRASKDCRVLLLPPPPPSRYDKRIGCSKKLAFPMHKDETTLARLLSEHGLVGDIEPPPESVQAAVLGELGSFTDAFQDEFRSFYGFIVQGRYKDASVTPFWGAVTDITWQLAAKEASTKGGYRLELDVGDPDEPLLYLLSDQRGMERLARHLPARTLPVPGKFRYTLEPARGGVLDPTLLARLGRESGLDRLAPWRQLLAGCVPFFEDERGRLCSDGAYYEDSPACFLLQAEHGARFVSRARQYNLKHSTHGIGQGGWKLVLVESISRGSLRALADLLPGLLHGVAGLGWARPRPRLSGGAWSGQALLLNLASNPVVRMADTTGGRYELLAEGGRVLAGGRLLRCEDDGFQVPHAALDGSRAIVALRYALHRGDLEEVHGDLRAIVLGGVPNLPLASLREPGAWLSDGASGCMEPAFRQEEPSARQPRANPRARVMAAHPFLLATNRDSAISVGRLDPDEFHGGLAWLREALHLRFQSRSTLPTRAAMAHVEGIAQVCGVPRWHVWSLLHAGGWLARIVRRTSPHCLSMARARTIALARGGTNPAARIAGMLGEAEVARLRGLLLQGEKVSRLCCDEPWLSLGTIEVELRDVGRLHELAVLLGIEVIDQHLHGSPLAESVHARFVAGDTSVVLPRDAELEQWDPREWKWLGHENHAGGTSAGAMFRHRRGQSAMHWVIAPDGHWKTDSDAWARIFHLAAHGEPIGELSANGDCTLDHRIQSLPPSLVRWWLHWGGGCVAIKPTGQLVLCGAQSEVDWTWAATWLHRDDARVDAAGPVDIALARRDLALARRLDTRRASCRTGAR